MICSNAGFVGRDNNNNCVRLNEITAYCNPCPNICFYQSMCKEINQDDDFCIKNNNCY